MVGATKESSLTLERGLALHQAVAEAESEAPSISELATAIGASRAAVYRLLVPLQARGLVRREGSKVRLGLGVLRLASNARHIIAIDPVPAKRALAEKVGATAGFAPDEEGLKERIVELTKGGVHHAIEAVGRISAGELAIALLRRGGTATIVGMMPIRERLSMGAMDLLAEKKLQGCLMGSNRFPVDIPRLVDFYLAGRLDIDSLVAERIGLADINRAVDKLRTGEAARSVIVFE